mmetsp:Transcript_3937/g.9383  ORF Transcript_3937/g.9383 Transcript_3937/m.9383 type:complete len:235 (+) Transcript_3937:322-1026(+)
MLFNKFLFSFLLDHFFVLVFLHDIFFTVINVLICDWLFLWLDGTALFGCNLNNRHHSWLLGRRLDTWVFRGTQEAETRQEKRRHGPDTESRRTRKCATVVVAEARIEANEDNALQCGKNHAQKDDISQSNPADLRGAGERQKVTKVDKIQTGANVGNEPGQFPILSQNVNELIDLVFPIVSLGVKIAVAIEHLKGEESNVLRLGYLERKILIEIGGKEQPLVQFHKTTIAQGGH